MNVWKRRSWFPIGLIVLLLGLLGVLAALQYSWLGQISESEQIRLEKRLQDDTKRFTEDFNKEINLVYNNFQISAESYKVYKWNEFNKRYLFWKTKTEFPGLVKDFYFLGVESPARFLRFDGEKKTFVKSLKDSQTARVINELKSQESFNPILQNETALAIPIYDQNDEVEKIVTQTRESTSGMLKTHSRFELPDKYGYLLVILNEKFITESLLPRLTEKYFADSDGTNYNVSIANESGKTVFQNHDGEISSTDSIAELFNLTPNNFFFIEKDSGRDDEVKSEERGKLIISSSNRISSEISESRESDKRDVVSVNVQKIEIGKPKIAVFEGDEGRKKGIWTLKVQHVSGSVNQFILNTRQKNLAISFGILGLLATSIILIFLSAQKARLLAQRQVDFVSSVSHEFRTPISVIYSAGENLSDGVIDDQEKISTYGNLIKREGKKLSGMVEQILEFAGARSGVRKYELNKVSVESVVNKALEECCPIIKEKGFEVEREIARDLRAALADENALTQAIQNLINNALKYSNGKKWIKISAENTKSGIRISVADRGIGISSKDQSQIFEPFYRAENVVDEQISGNGLGLSLVKQIVEGHGGKIAVESKLGNGSKFIIDLAGWI